MAGYFWKNSKHMRTKLVTGLCLLLAGPLLGQTSSPALNDLRWLLGSWERLQLPAGKSGIETWTESKDRWIGRGISMRGTDTTFVEKLSLRVESGVLYYVSDVPENKKPVYFRVTEASATSLVCENPAHDFPKKIAYRLEGDRLKATISGDGKAIDFFFRKRH